MADRFPIAVSQALEGLGTVIEYLEFWRRRHMKNKKNWGETKERFLGWWKHSNVDRPLMKIVAKRKTPLEDLEETWEAKTPEDKHLEVERKAINLRNYCRTHDFLAESFPTLDINIGAGSMAAYLGAEPEFSWNTVWFHECIDDWGKRGLLKYDPDNIWWKKHLEAIRRGQELSKGDFLVTIPDIIENVDILSAMRGAQNLCFDIMDEPELIKSYISQIDELYFRYYDAFYDIVKGEDGGSSYTVFSIWAPGRIGKIQCDYSAMISPDQFREFIVPSLRKQCQKLDFTLYHLDGPDAIRHLDALMEIDGIDALQWTAGAG